MFSVNRPTVALGLCASLLLASAQVHAQHQDPAPLPNEVVSKIVAAHAAPPQVASLTALNKHLDEISRLANASRGAAGRMLIAGKRHELAVARRDVIREFEGMRQRLVAQGALEQVTAWDALIAQVHERFDRLDRVSAAVDDDSEPRRDRALGRLRAELKTLRGDVLIRQTMPDQPVPSWTYQRKDWLAPRKLAVSDKLPQFERQKDYPTRYAMAGGFSVGLAPATPPEATSCGYTAADLAATADAPKDAAVIQALAAKLNYSPTQIFQYVYNTIKFEPYYGSLKGALVTLQSAGGGSTDQASLLIALLRASNIPARYVTGSVLIADASADPLGGRAARWVGAKSYVAAATILGQGGMTVSVSSPDAASAVDGVQTNHVWVEACVPYGRYRGASSDNSGTRWIPLDPSFKDKSYQSGIANSEAFDYASHLSKRINGPDSLPHEKYAQQVQAAVRVKDPNATVQDVPYTGSINPLDLDILPATLPYEVVKYTNWAGTTSPEIAALPDAHRYRLYIGGLNLPSTFSVALPDVVSGRITMSFKGATSGDQTALASWQADGKTTSSAPCTINVIPVLMIEGVVQNLPTPSSPLGLCSTSNVLSMEIGVKDLTPSNDPNKVGRVNFVSYSNISAANLYALQAYAFQGSNDLIAQRVATLTAKVSSTANPNANASALDAIQGEFLHLTGLKYMRYISDAAKRVGELDGGSGENGNHLGLTTAQTKVQYVFDLPFAVSRSGWLVDVRGGLDRGVDISTGDVVFKTFLLSSHASSNYESYIWQENAKLDAVSTVRGLQFANETGLGTVTLNSATWASVRPQLRVHAGTSVSDCAYSTPEYPRCLIDDPNNPASILAQVNSGATVTMPKALIQYGDWTGMVYTASKDHLATTGEASAFFAISKYAGGYSLGPELGAGSFSSSGDFNYITPSSPPTYISSPTAGTIGNTAPVTLPASNGITPVTTLSGDPVNMVSGNLYHNETDINIKGRGGFPLVFSRSYNSRNSEDGPLGFGWTHVFNARLKFYGVEGGQAKFSWIDGTGAEKFFATTSHTSGNITNGATIANPAGLFITVQRLSDGTYSIREKNGLTYKFASATGPSGVPGTATTPVFAALQSITDRKGNALSLSYAATTGCAGGTLLCTVTDAIGHTLSFTYSGAHITQIKDFAGRTYQYGYTDANNNLTSFKNPLAVAGKQNGVSFSYYTASDGSSLAHLMKQYTLPRGNGMKFEYYANGRVFRHTVVRTDGTASPDQVNLFTYNDFRRETIQTNERQGEKRFLFDPFGNPIKVVEENGAEHSYTYDCTDPSQAPGSASCPNPYNRLSETNPAGYKTQYSYDSNGNVTLITPPRGAAAATQYFDYNSFGQPRRIKDANGHWRIQRYDAAGNLTDAIRVVTSYTPPSCASAECAIPTAAQILEWTVNGYDAVGNLTSTKRVRDFAAQIASNTATSNSGPLVTYGFDTNKWNATTTSRIGIQNADTAASTVNTATLRYDPLGRLTSGVDADWYATQYSYDDLDRPLQATDRLGQLRSYQFDANGNAVGQSLTVSVNGVSTQVDSSSTRFDDSDRAIQSLDAGGFATAFTYDAAGNVLTVTNPDGYVVSFDYDAANRPIYAYDQEGHAVATKRDTSGRTRTVTDPNGNTTTSTYWDATRDGRLKQISYPRITNNGSGSALTAGRAVQYDHDAMGNVTSVTEVPAAGSGQANRTTSTTYDELDRPIRVVGPQYTDSVKGAICPVVRNTYDTLGRLTQVAAGHTPSPCTTAASDVTTVQQTFAYDDFGRKISSADGLGRTWRYSYDANNNVIQATDPKAQVTTYSWDAGHQLKTRTEQGGRTTSYTRNALGQVLKVTHPNVNYSYSYDAAHRLTSVTDSRGNKTLSYDWSAGGLLNAITDSDGRQTSYLYDPVGRLTGITAPNGDTLAYQFDAGGRLIQRSMPNGVSARFAYNEDNSLRQVVNRDTASHILTQHDYAYDGVGQRASQVQAIGGSRAQLAYTYDELKRLTQVVSTAADTHATTTTAYGYDPLGNRTTLDDDGLTMTLQYDAANQLKRWNLGGFADFAVSHDANGNVLSDGLRTYSWDALDQLSQVSAGTLVVNYSYDDSGRRIAKSVGGAKTQWTYDGQDIYAEYPASWATPSAVYTGGGATDDPVIRASTTGPSSYGTASYYHADGLGSVVGLSNNADASTQTQRLDAFGNKQSSDMAQSAQYGYTGREPDETGLVYYRARYYGSEFGRFISRDPAGLQGGINAYAYCGNNPTNCTDPLGLMPQSALSSFVDTNYYGPGVQVADASGMNALSYLKDARRAVQGWFAGAEGLSATLSLPAATRNSDAFQAGYSARQALDPYIGTIGSVFNALTLGGSTAPGLPMAGAAGAIGRIEGVATQGETTVYRAFGGDARAQGFSWTTKDPRIVNNFRDAAGLPSGGPSGATNTADFLIQGQVKTKDIIKSRSALPLDGNKGGLLELIIDPKNVKITDFSILNP